VHKMFFRGARVVCTFLIWFASLHGPWHARAAQMLIHPVNVTGPSQTGSGWGRGGEIPAFVGTGSDGF